MVESQDSIVHPAGGSISLPEPTTKRWKPLRLGLVELFHYDSEEFWFKDGHLLLRGNNGTGKSKVLSLTMPFLLDANLKSSRIEPDGDSGKRMSWNLLMGTLDRRIGYAWIEFGCVSASGEYQFLTLGAGMLASAGKTGVDSWYFLIEGGERSPRMNRDLWLTNADRVVLTKDRLRDAIQGHGQLFPNAVAYRRAVDERLFRLGQVRYDALIDTLIQLRQPQLSKKPDEVALSAALSEALPPIAVELLVDVADALGKLEDERHILDQYQSLSGAVHRFEERYRTYAGTRSRREAKALRHAQTDFDNASRAKNDAEERFHKAEDAERTAKSNETTAELSVAEARTSYSVLQDDPANVDAKRLDRATERVADSRKEHVAASQAATRAKKTADVAEEQLRTYSERVRSHARDADKHASDSASAADACSFPETLLGNVLLAKPGSQLHSLEAAAYDRARGELRGAVPSRREGVALVRSLLAVVEKERLSLENTQRRCDQARDDLEEARESRAAAEDKFDTEGRAHVQAWSEHAGGLRELRIDVDETLAGIGDWVLNPETEHPGRKALEAAHAATAFNLASEQTAIEAERRAAQVRIESLQQERAELVLGTDPEPTPPLTRGAEVRASREGAPLWKLVDFVEDVPPEIAAALEAALEASGILDAWVTPAGELVAVGGDSGLLDTTLNIRGVSSSSIAQWLVPVASDVVVVESAHVQRLLESIGCAEADTGDEAWIGLNGGYRLGLVSGTWRKAEASYIGATSRARARTRRIAEIDLSLQELSDLLVSLQALAGEVVARRDRARSELQSAPSEAMLRTWRAQCEEAIKAERRAGQRLDEAQAALAEVKERHAGALLQLEQDAADLQLPFTPGELAAVEDALAAFESKVSKLLESVQMLRTLQPELVAQQQRRDDAQGLLEEAVGTELQRHEQLVEAEAELKTLESTVGLKVQELRDELARLRTAVDSSEKAAKAARQEAQTAGEARAVAATTFDGKKLALDQQVELRGSAIARLQQFAASGVLGAGAPDLAIPELVAPWTIDPALGLARRMEQALAHLSDSDDAWNKVQKHINEDLSTLQSALSGLGYQCNGEQTDFGLVVSVVYQNRPESPDRLAKLLEREIADRSELLTSKEKEVLENHLQAEIAAEVQRLLKMADDHVSAINEELKKHPTSTGVKFRLLWEPLAETEGAPLGLPEARKRLLNTSSDLWSADDRKVVGTMLQQRIQAERELADAGAHAGTSLSEQLARALDYRRWHRFRVERWQANQWRKLSGPASSGERALGLTVPLFAAVASFYGRSEGATAPRLMLLDEAFAGIDDAARAHCMALIREFDLDFIITSEREWACYAELPGVSICQLQRREGVDAVYVSRWTWDGKAKKQQPDPDSRFPSQA